MAPPGKHVMSCFVHYTPYHLKGSDWNASDRMADNVQQTLESFFPGFSDLVLQRRSGHPARHRAGGRPAGGQHLPW
ncbi:MAG: hypothetical protein R2713_23075 [Ilumatobacteraceae bacterium]